MSAPRCEHSRPWVASCVLAAALLLAPACQAAGPQGATGSWRGSYTCLQGITGLTLDIDPASSGRVTAVFTFFAAPTNPTVPSGCFKMSGTYDAPARHLDLAPGRWLLRPPGYVTVALSGDIAPDGGSMAGSVLGPDCGAFALQRLSPVPTAFARDCQPLHQVASR